VQPPRLISRQLRESANRSSAQPQQPRRLADSAPLGNVLQHGQAFWRRQPAVKQQRTLTLAESRPAGSTVQQPKGLAFTVMSADRQIHCPAFAEVGATRVLTTKPRQVIHDLALLNGWRRSIAAIRTSQPIKISISTIGGHQGNSKLETNSI